MLTRNRKGKRQILWLGDRAANVDDEGDDRTEETQDPGDVWQVSPRTGEINPSDGPTVAMRLVLLAADEEGGGRDAAFFAPYLQRTNQEILMRWAVMRALEENEGGQRLNRLTSNVHEHLSVGRSFIDRDGDIFGNDDDFQDYLRGKLAAEFCLPTGRRTSLEALGLVRVSLDKERLAQAAHNVSRCLPARLQGDAPAVLELLLETVRRALCISRPGGVTLDDTFIWGGDHAKWNLRVALNGGDPKSIRFNWLPAQNDTGRLYPNRRYHFLKEQLQIDNWEDVLKNAFRALTTAGLLVGDTKQPGAFVVDINQLVFEDGRAMPLYRCRRCGIRQFTTVLNKCTTFRCDGDMETVDVAERRTEQTRQFPQGLARLLGIVAFLRFAAVSPGAECIP